MKYYIAYGSNLNLEQMKDRCPTACPISTGWVQDYELLFRGYPNRAVATIEPSIGSKVPVLVWGIQQGDEQRLDRYEGFPSLYRKESLQVQLNTQETLTAMLYLINGGHINSPSLPYYKTIEQGYLENNLDISYLKQAVQKCL